MGHVIAEMSYLVGFITKLIRDDALLGHLIDFLEQAAFGDALVFGDSLNGRSREQYRGAICVNEEARIGFGSR